MKYNERKRVVLDAIRTLEEDGFYEITSNDVYEYLMDYDPFLEKTAIKMALYRYHRQGLLRRRRTEGVTRSYELTSKGLRRLIWLQENE